jgi:hypothetical protein
VLQQCKILVLLCSNFCITKLSISFISSPLRRLRIFVSKSTALPKNFLSSLSQKSCQNHNSFSWQSSPKMPALIFLHTILLQYTHYFTTVYTPSLLQYTHHFTTIYTPFYYNIHTVLLQYTHYFTIVYTLLNFMQDFSGQIIVTVFFLLYI